MINYAFLIGCEEYKSSDFPKLNNIQYDLNMMKEALVKYCDCSAENVVEISDNSSYKPNYMEVFGTINDVSNKCRKTKIHNLFFYFSGHGAMVDDEACLMLKDCMIGQINIGCLPIREICSVLKRIFNYDYLILILDMCQNEIRGKGGAETGIIDSGIFKKGTVCFYSCFPHAKSFMIPDEFQEELGKGSVFTNVFVNALKDDNCFTVNEITTYIEEHINQYNRTLKRIQNPYTTLQASTLGKTVLLKKKSETKEEKENGGNSEGTRENTTVEVEGSNTSLEISEYDSIDTTGVKLKEEELKSVLNLVRYIDSLEEDTRWDYGEEVLDRTYGLNIIGLEPVSYSQIEKQFRFVSVIYEAGQDFKIRRSIIAKYSNESSLNDAILSSIDTIVRELDNYKSTFINNKNTYQELEKTTQNQLKSLAIYINAGKIYMKRNPTKNLDDLRERINRLEINLKTTKTMKNSFQKRIKNNKEYIRITDDYKNSLFNIKLMLVPCMNNSDIWNKDVKRNAVSAWFYELKSIKQMVSDYNDMLNEIITR